MQDGCHYLLWPALRKETKPVHLSENRDGEGPEEQHSSNNHSKSDFLPIKLLIYIVLKSSERRN